MPRKGISKTDIEALLAQTQCGECGYNGCAPYAQAILEDNAAINLCRPGGKRVIRNLAELLSEKEFLPAKKQENPLTAFIIEEDCIGCTLCIQACPTDCIEGEKKQIHKVNIHDCTGCRLCLDPCPVDCIEIIPNDELAFVNKLSGEKKEQWETERATYVAELVRKNEEKITNKLKRRLTPRKPGGRKKIKPVGKTGQSLAKKLSTEQLAKINKARQKARKKYT